MSLSATPSAERLHIGFFGVRNAGKSSLVNAVTAQQLSIVSPTKGTTTDPVKKAMELLPLGPVVIIDTPGLDDEGELGALRVQKTRQVLRGVDIAVLVADAQKGLLPADRELLALVGERGIPCVIAYNKADLLAEPPAPPAGENALYVSALTGQGVQQLKEHLGACAKKEERAFLPDMVQKGDSVVLVVPIDESAPKGRLILPQQRTIRELLDAGAAALVCQPEELAGVLQGLKTPPRLVITDSQVFGRVAAILPEEQPLTSFSILFARYKGDLSVLARGARKLGELRDGDKVLIAEGCTHHRQCADIGTVKLPGWIRDFSGSEPQFSFTSGGDFPEDIGEYALIVHCGACMLGEGEMAYRIRAAQAAGVAIVNYGVAIAQMHGILRRSLQPFPAIAALLEE